MAELTTRAKLQELRAQATEIAEEHSIMNSWKRAWEDLADAADHLDAMIARTEEEDRV
jgi:hypothetical protein